MKSTPHDTIEITALYGCLRRADCYTYSGGGGLNVLLRDTHTPEKRGWGRLVESATRYQMEF